MNRTIAYCALVETAKRNNIPLDTVLYEINSAISMAMNDPDPCVQSFWGRVPSAGEIPTSIELIAHILDHHNLNADPLQPTP